MEITTEVIEDFRTYYPEFSDDYVWTNPSLRRALCEADSETGSKRWGAFEIGSCKLKNRGMYAYAAHRIVLDSLASRAVSAGGVPSGASQVQSKSVADESVSYAAQTPESSGIADQTGDLRSTKYGLEFLRLRKRAGMGAAVV